LESTDEHGEKNIEFPFINFNDIIAATDNFSNSNMLGKGGFGNVYQVRVLKNFPFSMKLTVINKILFSYLIWND